MSEPDFPYAYTPEPGVPRFLRVTAEGRPLAETVRSGLAYLRKYRRAKWTAPAEEVRHFDAQRRLLRAMPPGPAVSRLAVVGDLMWLRDGWDAFVSPEVRDHLAGHAAVIGNLESPISPRFRVPSLWPDYLTYNSAPGLVTSFRRADGSNLFAALTTANNHSLDRGPLGLADTLDFLDAQGIAHAGARRSPEDRPYALFDAGGIRVGLYAACWGLNAPSASPGMHVEVQPGLAPHVTHPADLTRLRRAVAGMTADGAALRVVYLHWGHEFEFYPRPELMRVARDVVAAGADVVLGSHPHVVQPMEVVAVEDERGGPREALVAYSLGNFATAMFTPHCRTGLVLSIPLSRDPDTGRVAWHRPETRLVYNAPREPGTGRGRLVMLDDYLRGAPRRGDELRDLGAWLERHLWGEA